MKYSKLSIRMKQYEGVSRNYLVKKTPVIIRIDGKAFHTFTKKFKKPFDSILMTTMQETMKSLCESIQGCVFGYTQSDEISLLLLDDKKEDSAAWFEYNVQKCSSIAASIATLYFNKFFAKHVSEMDERFAEAWNVSDEDMQYLKVMMNAENTGAMFDARAFNLPRSEIANYFFWRQDDASRNSIQMAGHAYFSNAQMKSKSNDQVQEMLFSEKGINWNDYPIPCKRGTACIKRIETFSRNDGTTFNRCKWFIDKEMPILRNEGRQYVERLL